MKLEEIIDVEILQKIQDGFSDAFELPSIIYDNKGQAITKPSRFTKFCEFVRSTPKGCANCEKFDALLMKEITKHNEPTTRKGCALKNIITVTIPIIINEIHYANFGIGQIVDNDFDFDEIKNYAKEIDVDEAELLKAAKTLIPIKKSLLSNSVKFLNVISEQISILGYQNLQNKEFIIKQKLAEQELIEAKEKAEESEAKFKSLTNDVLDNQDVGVFILNADFQVLWINKRIEHFFGIDKNKVIGSDKKQTVLNSIQYVFENPEEFN